MVRRGRRKTVAREQAGKYMTVARGLRKSAADMVLLAEKGHGNAIGIVAIHAAIAYTDALCIAYAGFKSSEGDHERAVDAVRQALGSRTDATQASRLLSILKEKDAASYQGVFYTLAQAQRLIRKLEVFADWAETMYDQRPSA